MTSVVVVTRRHELQDVARHAAAPRAVAPTATPSPRLSGAGFKMTALPAASAAQTPPAGIAYGKFHGGTTTTVPSGVESVEVGGRRRVEAREVDPLAHLGIGLGLGLAARRAPSPRSWSRFAGPPSRARSAKRIRRRSSIESLDHALAGDSPRTVPPRRSVRRRRPSTGTTAARRRSDRGRLRTRRSMISWSSMTSGIWQIRQRRALRRRPR